MTEPPQAFCHQCGQFVPKEWITYEVDCNEYCIDCELEMKTQELQAIVNRIDFLKLLRMELKERAK
jgi:hypothetical protein